MGGWFKSRVDSLDDLKGLKMRIPGQGGKVMDALGVNVQVLAAGEIYPALERGAIDATEWVGPYDDEKLGFYKVAKNYYYPGWWEPGPNLSFLVNQEAWDKLPAEYKAMIEAATREGGTAMMTRYDAKNPAAWRRLLKTDITVRRFPDDLLAAAREAAEELQEKEAAADKGYAKILQQWRAFRDESFEWFGAAELAYSNFAMGENALGK
jgi:TRAP-type mannitol/chloroaromatic compound transport system substrate-binding protein